MRRLADRIIDAQVREIAEMKRNIVRLEADSTAGSAPDLPHTATGALLRWREKAMQMLE